MLRKTLLYPTATLVLMATVMMPFPAAAMPTGLPGQIRGLLMQLDARPELQVAGEPVFMLPELLQLYAQRDYHLLWSTDDARGREQITELLRALSATESNGLCAGDYHVPFFRQLLRNVPVAEDLLPQWSSWYDLLLTDGLLHYLHDTAAGRVPSESVQEGWNARRDGVNLLKMLNHALEHDSLAALLADLEPGHRDYLALQRTLGRYREIEAFGGWPAIPGGATLRSGESDERVTLLRTRLLLSGDLADIPADPALRFSAADAAALARFQKRHGLAADGVLGERTLAALNVPVADRVRQIELNLERWRWLPHRLGRDYLLVNIADFSLKLVADGRTVLSMPVVVGNSYRKTPVFSAWLEYIEFAPYWYVPPTIFAEDKLPLIRKDPEYLARNHYEIVKWDRTSPLSRDGFSWAEIDGDNFPGILRQKPGPWNALGRVKFMLPNPYAIYLHDTNERNLFDRKHRSFSSGCIRVSRPTELAEALLAPQGWDIVDVAVAMDGNTPERVDLASPLPVHVLYWTAWVDDEGRVNFRDDVYGRDRDLRQALDRVPSTCPVPELSETRLAHDRPFN